MQTTGLIKSHVPAACKSDLPPHHGNASGVKRPQSLRGPVSEILPIRTLSREVGGSEGGSESVISFLNEWAVSRVRAIRMRSGSRSPIDNVGVAGTFRERGEIEYPAPVSNKMNRQSHNKVAFYPSVQVSVAEINEISSNATKLTVRSVFAGRKTTKKASAAFP